MIAGEPNFYPQYGYDPALGTGIVFSFLFGLLALIHFGLSSTRKPKWYFVVAIGATTELIGWIGRTLSGKDNTASVSWLIIQITTSLPDCSSLESRRQLFPRSNCLFDNRVSFFAHRFHSEGLTRFSRIGPPSSPPRAMGYLLSLCPVLSHIFLASLPRCLLQCSFLGILSRSYYRPLEE